MSFNDILIGLGAGFLWGLLMILFVVGWLLGRRSWQLVKRMWTS
jgi:hypothetical protein